MDQIISDKVKDYMNEIKTECGNKDERLYTIFNKTFLDTLQNALKVDENNNVFVLTGDIPAMWQRDSSAQLRPYLLLAKSDEHIKDIITRVVKRQFFNMNLDPYANAFNMTANNQGHQTDKTDMSPWIWERKYELDSLCYPVQLAYLLYKNTGETAQFDDKFVSGIKKMLRVIQIEQHHENSDYTFERDCDVPTDTLKNDGKGTPVAYTGMSWSGFRPSDDACTYGYLIPSNMFAVVVLGYIQEIFSTILDDSEIVAKAKKLQEEINAGIQKYGIVEHNGKKQYAYEVDGKGNYLLMDDSNVPSLMSAPYIGYVDPDDAIYQNTRRFILSPDNPYFYIGEYWSGQGSPHTPKGNIWPIGMALVGLTQKTKEEKQNLLYLMANTTNGTNMIHESFNPNDPSDFTRPWFSWANMMFCELLLSYLGHEISL